MQAVGSQKFSSIHDVVNVLRALAVSHPFGSWLQIGANTLDKTQNRNDPFMKVLPHFSSYRKIFVEPLPHLSKKLRKNTRKFPNSIVVEAAILPSEHDEPQNVTMFCLSKKDPHLRHVYWPNQICSFDATHITKHFPQALPEGVIVKGMCVRDLMEMYTIADVQVLLIDTEGYDFKVLNQLPFNSSDFKPSIISYEHKHLSRKEKKKASALMLANMYALADDGENIYAWHA
jgi:FkbM family methyltransferase